MAPLISCPHCQIPCKTSEVDCVHCGGRLRGADGRIALTAAAAILGLTVAACGEKEPPAANPYGVPVPTETAPEPTVEPSADPPPTPSAPGSGSANAPEEPPAAPAYGVVPMPGEQ